VTFVPLLGRTLSAALVEGRALALRASVLLAAAPKKQHRLAGDDEAHKLWHWIEDNGEYVFPLIGIVILGLVILAVRRGSLSQQEELSTRARQKEQIIRLMRKKLSLTADATAQELHIDRYHAAALLEELEREGVLAPGRQSGGSTLYRLKGL
jgi:hypothetical protein